jgi:hypothetical protein
MKKKAAAEKAVQREHNTLAYEEMARGRYSQSYCTGSINQEPKTH